MSTTSASRQKQISTAQERLLALLDGHKVEATLVPAGSSACPKCGIPEFKEDMWCSECGYCPKAGFAGSLQVEPEHTELHFLQLVPAWLWLTLGVELLLIVAAIAFSFAIGGHCARTIVSASLLALGSLLVVVSHFRAYFSTLSSTHSQGTLDIVMKPGMIWRSVFLGLPNTSFLISSVVWGFTGMLLSVFVIGGLDYMSIHHFVARDKPVRMPSVTDVARAVAKGTNAMQNGEAKEKGELHSLMGGLHEAAADDQNSGDASSQNIDDAVTQFAGTTPMPDQEGAAANDTGGAGDANQTSHSGDEKPDDSEESADDSAVAVSEQEEGEAATTSDVSPDESLSEIELLTASLPPGQLVTCAIVGYTINTSGEPRSLLLAAPAAGGWRYIARMSIDDVPADVVADLTSEFPDHLSPRPLVDCPFGGQWLTPDFFCDIHFAETATGLRTAEPTFVRMQDAP